MTYTTKTRLSYAIIGICAIILFGLQITHAGLTDMQLLIKFWWVYALCLLTIVGSAYILQ